MTFKSKNYIFQLFYPIAIISCLISGNLHATIMTFGDGPSSGQAPGFTYSEGGYTMTTSGGSFNWRGTWTPSNSNFSGGYVETWNSDVVFTFTNDLNLLFDFTGIDIGHVLSNPANWIINGFNGASLVNSLTVSTNDVISDYSAFTNLTSLTIQGGSDPAFASFDNISFSAAVPEPSILALMGTGILGLGFARRRHQA